MPDKPESPVPPRPAPGGGLVVGGLGGPEDELLESGQEEVFSRTEVERGRIEHHVASGGEGDDPQSEPRGDDKGLPSGRSRPHPRP